ncbi:antileukoproteinase [Perognathus longimembris pacificus]|uniref:antileukoproteinase n=1 Tax=Perognathus longimembris pacificus TaxID=214514 RepID=UPI002018C102|nr:antileukoproteinase [Perognathus longimembris pacificus]
MKCSSLLPIVVLFALGTLASWVVEGSEKASAKIGACPSRKPAKCLVYEKPACKSDWNCPGKKKCCRDNCGIKCLAPVAISKPVNKKPGKCPVVNARCMMLNPPNRCETDGQCERNYKCCEGMCGKACILPVAA